MGVSIRKNRFDLQMTLIIDLKDMTKVTIGCLPRKPTTFVFKVFSIPLTFQDICMVCLKWYTCISSWHIFMVVSRLFFSFFFSLSISCFCSDCCCLMIGQAPIRLCFYIQRTAIMPERMSERESVREREREREREIDWVFIDTMGYKPVWRLSANTMWVWIRIQDNYN